MAYSKHTWTTGETITAEKLNNIENGVANAGGVLKLTLTEDPNNAGTYVCNHTWQEIYNALSNGVIAVLVEAYDEGENEVGVSMYMVESVEHIDDRYIISNRYGTVASAQAPNDYPSSTE